VLHGLSFVVPRGSVCGLLGPSGCGKTTLMRAIVGVQAGVTGEVRRARRARRFAGAAPPGRLRHPEPAVYGDLTVRENVDYFADVLRRRACRRVPRARDVGLADRPTSSSARCPAGSGRAWAWRPRS
jgi:ABC-2 type transport system ATP-binding protein